MLISKKQNIQFLSNRAQKAKVKTGMFPLMIPTTHITKDQ